MPIFFSGAPKDTPGVPAGTWNADKPRRGVRRRAREQQPEVGVRPVADPGLRAVDDVVIAVEHGLRRDRRHVGSGLRLGQGIGAELFAAEHARQPGRALVVGAEACQRGRRQRVHGDVDADAHPGGRDLLEHLQVDLVRLSAAALLLRERQREQPGLAEQREHVARELRVGLGLGGPRRELLGRDLADQRRSGRELRQSGGGVRRPWRREVSIARIRSDVGERPGYDDGVVRPQPAAQRATTCGSTGHNLRLNGTAEAGDLVEGDAGGDAGVQRLRRRR